MDNTQLLTELSIADNGQEREFTHGGKSYKFNIARLVSVSEMLAMRKKIDGRAETLKRQKKIAVIIIPEAIAGREALFPEASLLPDGKMQILVTSEEDANVCTLLEMAVREPALSWAEAVILSRVNGPLVLKIVAAFKELNGELMEGDAKND
jgi:hypothetical protein